MKWLKKLTGNWWVVRKCLWPYPVGYATYLPAKKMILDTGLSKEEAQRYCDELNKNTEK